ncbi:MAG: SCO family protein [Alphaproteobacteria bacterium]
MNKLFSIVALLFLVATAVLLWATQGRQPAPEADAVAVSGEDAEGYVAPASVGGKFTLIDHTGAERTEQDYRGKIMLVFFGFTHCPDICPVTVSTFSSLMELLGDKADKVAPLFISVDPGRDTPAVMKDYLSNFDARIVGLTGTAEQVKSAADAYKVYYAQAQQPTEQADGYGAQESGDHSAHVGHGAGDNYMVDHSGYVYLMDPQGNYVEHFRYDVSEQELADAIKPYLQ